MRATSVTPVTTSVVGALASLAVVTRVLEAITVTAITHRYFPSKFLPPCDPQNPMYPRPCRSQVPYAIDGTTTHPVIICVALLLWVAALVVAARATMKQV